MRPPAKAPVLPGIEVWVEEVDGTVAAVMACRRWEGVPRLTVWKLVDCAEIRYGWRGYGAAMLMAVEQRAHPRWYKYAQRTLERYVNDYGHAVGEIEAVKQFHAMLPEAAKAEEATLAEG